MKAKNTPVIAIDDLEIAIVGFLRYALSHPDQFALDAHRIIRNASHLLSRKAMFDIYLDMQNACRGCDNATSAQAWRLAVNIIKDHLKVIQSHGVFVAM